MNNIGVIEVPFIRGVFNNIVAYTNDQAGIFQNLCLIVLHRYADCPERIRIIKGNGSFSHHRINDGKLQLFSELR